jgi:hypothetical protein
MDVQAWSGLTRLREVAERLRPRLRAFRDPDGKELLDLPGAPLPDPDTPAPPRFLPEYDNIVLGHADRTRIVPGGVPAAWPTDGLHWSPLLVDGFVGGVWHLSGGRQGASLVVRPFQRPPDTAALAEEGERLLAFLAPDAADRRVDLHG